MSGNFKDLTGQKYGRLEVITKAEKRGGRISWLCRCKCGKEVIVMSCNLTTGHTESCGCKLIESSHQVNFKHGKRHDKIYSIWQNMLNRCRNKNVRSYKDYGGRGISVCDEWLIFDNFFKDMGDPVDGMTLDRKDVNLGYCLENCRWANIETQQNNTRKNRLITFAGKTSSIAQWAKETGINPNRIWLRLRAGWSVDEALTTPIRKMKRKSEWQIAPRT